MTLFFSVYTYFFGVYISKSMDIIHSRTSVGHATYIDALPDKSRDVACHV